jgi:hypothetical protein
MNRNVFLLSILSGILLVIAGIHGSIGVYGTILSFLALFFQDVHVLSFLEIVALILVFVASLGGFSVMFGGYLVYKSQVRLGKLIISLGTGIGIPGLLLAMINVMLVKQEFSTVIAQYGIIGWTGIILSLIARIKAK